MPTAGPEGITRLLEAAGGGCEEALHELVTLVYDELKEIARRQQAGVVRSDAFQTTVLVHEAYIRLMGNGTPDYENRRHFFFAAARAMRDIVVEQARKHAAAKRGAGWKHVSLDETVIEARKQAEELLALDEALSRLDDETSARVVMLRFFAGMTRDETASALGLSLSVVDRNWAYARAWLGREMTRSD